MELPLKSSAMTLFLFQYLVFCFEVTYTLVPDADQVAKNLKESVSLRLRRNDRKHSLRSQPGTTMSHYTGGTGN